MCDIFTRQDICVKISHIYIRFLYTINMMNILETHSESVIKQRVRTALQRVLKPLVRLALSQGINYQMLLETLKIVFVQVADCLLYTSRCV